MQNQTDIDILKELECQLRMRFIKIVISEFDSCKEGTTNYAVDDNENIIGLYISELFLTNIPPEVYKFENLIYLSFRSNEIRDISSLKDLKKLKILDLFDNRIQDISALKDLKELKELNLSYNQIQDISVLKNLPQLEKLNLNDNKISDFSVLKVLNLINT